MSNQHVVNNHDGLSHLWLIAKHYRVSFCELQSLNPGILARHSPGDKLYGMLQVGDKVQLPKNQLSDKEVGSPYQRCPLDKTQEPYWRAFLFVLADEILPSGKLVRKIISFPATTQAQYILHHPEIFGLTPPHPESMLSLGEHALGENQSRYLSASTKPKGAPNIGGRPIFIDIKKALAAGAKIHSTQEIIDDLNQLVKDRPELSQRVEKLKKVIAEIEGEVLIEGAVPASAIKSRAGMALTRSLRGVQVLGVAFTVYDVGKASVKSIRQQSVKPIAAESIRQIGGWGGAWLGMKVGSGVGAGVGAAAGIELGPGAIGTGVIGGAIGGFIFGIGGYFGADWVADLIDEN
jgi:hypothetical protein